MAFWYSEYSSLLVAPQSAFGTPNTTFSSSSSLGDFKGLLVDKPKFTPATEVVETDLLTGVIAASPERLVGRRHGTLTFSQPLESLVKGYDGTDVNPGDIGVIPHWMCILAAGMGSNIPAIGNSDDFWKGVHLSNSQYLNDNVISWTPPNVVLDGTTGLDAGQLLLAAGSMGDNTPAMSYIKSISGGTASLFESPRNAPQAGDATFGTTTAWVSANAVYPFSFTFRWIGKDGALCYVLTDAVLESAKVTWESGSVPTVEFSFRVFDYQLDDTFSGGLVIPDGYNRVPQIVGGVNGAATIDGTQFGGIEKAEFTYKIEMKEVKNHNASQGIGTVTLVKPRLTASFSVPHDNDASVSDGQYIWQSKLATQTPVSVGCYVGSYVGKVFSFLIPAARIVAVPALEDRDGIIAYTLSLEASKWTGDSSSSPNPNGPMNSLFRVSLG
jgi:hypothetical protein